MADCKIWKQNFSDCHGLTLSINTCVISHGNQYLATRDDPFPVWFLGQFYEYCHEYPGRGSREVLWKLHNGLISRALEPCRFYRCTRWERLCFCRSFTNDTFFNYLDVNSPARNCFL